MLWGLNEFIFIRSLLYDYNKSL